MQHVTAFSRPQTVPAVPAAPRKPNLWILDSWRDLILYVGLVFAYGSLAYFNSHLGIETVKRVLTGVVTASALLHFYYDGFFDEAKMHYLEALRSNPKLAVAYNSLGNLYLKQGQVSQAIVQFSEALRLDPSYKDAEENLRIAKASDAQFFPRAPK